MTDLAKKLSMKKTFFVTQLESFFSSITQEYQERVNSLEIENKLLKEKNDKLEYDVNNLVKIKNELIEKTETQQESIDILTHELQQMKKIKSDEYNLDLIRENNKLKKEVEKLNEELKNIQNKQTSNKGVMHRGANAYNQNLMQKKNEEIIKEIAKSLKK